MATPDRPDDIEKGAMEEHEFKEADKELAIVSSDGKSPTNDETEGKGKSDQDVVFIQDTGFTVKVVAPNLEPFDIQVLIYPRFVYSFLLHLHHIKTRLTRA